MLKLQSTFQYSNCNELCRRICIWIGRNLNWIYFSSKKGLQYFNTDHLWQTLLISTANYICQLHAERLSAGPNCLRCRRAAIHWIQFLLWKHETDVKACMSRRVEKQLNESILGFISFCCSKFPVLKSPSSNLRRLFLSFSLLSNRQPSSQVFYHFSRRRWWISYCWSGCAAQ